MKRPNIYEQYKAQYFDPSWLPYLMNHYRTFNLPTEFVAHEPGFFAPRQGRIYDTDLCIWNLGEEIFMVEHYENWGDDGHTSMELQSYIFVPKAGLELVDVYGRKEFAYVKTLQEKATQPDPWKCDLCGHGADECDGHYGEGFQ